MYQPKITGKYLKKKEQPAPDLLGSLESVVKLVSDLKEARNDVIEKVENKLSEVDQVIAEVREIKKGEDGKDADAQEIAEAVSEYVLNQIPVPKDGLDGKDADEKAIVSKVLSLIPKVDEESLIQKAISRMPKAKPDLKVITRDVETDPMDIIERIMALPEEKLSRLRLPSSSISGLEQTVRAFHSQLGRGYLHGGGLSTVSHDATLTGDGTPASPLSVVTTASGIDSLNGDSSTAQFLVTGTAGTNFGIVDSGTGTHTFNLPVASALNTGKLSSADWTTFNNKVSTGFATASGLTMNPSKILGRTTALAGAIEELSVSGGVELIAGNIQSSAYTGDVTKSAGGTATTIANNAVTNAKFRQSAGLSVVGNATNATADVADIAGSVPFSVLRVSGAGTALEFGGGGAPTFGFIGATTGAGSTLYYAINSNVTGVAFASRAARQVPFPAARTVRNFFIKTNTSQPGTGSQVVSVHLNAAVTALTITIAAGSAAGTFSDTANSVAVAQGDLISYEAVNNASSNSATIQSASFMNY